MCRASNSGLSVSESKVVSLSGFTFTSGFWVGVLKVP